MHHFLNHSFSFRGILALFLGLGVLNATPSWGASGDSPVENPSQQLQRTAASGNELRTTLTHNIMKQVPYEASYTVQVPYQEQEAYTDYETYVDQEYRCHTEYDHRQDCHMENQCYDVPGQRQCHTENQCYEVPGGKQCRPVEKCYETPGHRECRQQQVCRDVTVPREVCGYESVTKTRPVTKYRTVTRYRTETRCCVTKYREEFDHQVALDVLVQFPGQAMLTGNEVESFELSLRGDEAQLSAQFEAQQTIYGYQIVDQRLNGRTYVISLGLVAKYSAADLGEQTVSDPGLIFANGQATVLFNDQGQKIRVNSQYRVEILRNGTLVGEARGVSPGLEISTSEVRLPVNGNLDENQNYELKLSVLRSGIVLTGPVQFSKAGLYDPTPLENADQYMDSSRLTNFDILGVGVQSGLYFKDNTKISSQVTTTYKVSLQTVINGSAQVIGVAVLDRRNIKVNSEGLLQILLTRDMKIADDIVRNAVTKSAVIQVDIEIQRQSARLNHGQPIQLKKSFTDRNRD